MGKEKNLFIKWYWENDNYNEEIILKMERLYSRISFFRASPNIFFIYSSF